MIGNCFKVMTQKFKKIIINYNGWQYRWTKKRRNASFRNLMPFSRKVQAKIK